VKRSHGACRAARFRIEDAPVAARESRRNHDVPRSQTYAGSGLGAAYMRFLSEILDEYAVALRDRMESTRNQSRSGAPVAG
jgi:hypothetical protein